MVRKKIVLSSECTLGVVGLSKTAITDVLQNVTRSLNDGFLSDKVKPFNEPVICLRSGTVCKEIFNKYSVRHVELDEYTNREVYILDVSAVPSLPKKGYIVDAIANELTLRAIDVDNKNLSGCLIVAMSTTSSKSVVLADTRLG